MLILQKSVFHIMGIARPIFRVITFIILFLMTFAVILCVVEHGFSGIWKVYGATAAFGLMVTMFVIRWGYDKILVVLARKIWPEANVIGVEDLLRA